MAKGAYIGVPTEVPVYDDGGIVQITENNVTEHFDISTTDENGNGFTGVAGVFSGVKGTWSSSKISESTWTAKHDAHSISFEYVVGVKGASTSASTIFTVTVNGTEVVNEEVKSTTESNSGSWSGSINAGETIVFYDKNTGTPVEVFNIVVDTKTQVGTEIVDVAHKVKSGYIGVPTEVPVYGEGTVTITEDNVEDYFDGYYKSLDGNQFVGSAGVFSSVASTGSSSVISESEWEAKNDIDNLSFDYVVGSKASLANPNFSITIAGVEVVSSSTAGETGTWSGAIKKGETIVFYSKNGKTASTISNVVFTGQVQVGTETKDVARKVKKIYVGANGVAKLCYASAKYAYTDVGVGSGSVALVSYATSSSTSQIIYYSDSFVFDDQTGLFTLVNPSTISISYSKYSDITPTLLGKYYIDGRYDDAMGSYNTMFKAPDSGTAKRGTQSVDGKTYYRTYFDASGRKYTSEPV